jgi:hypothetical protein
MGVIRLYWQEAAQVKTLPVTREMNTRAVCEAMLRKLNMQGHHVGTIARHFMLVIEPYGYVLAANDCPLQVQEQMVAGGIVFADADNRFVFKLNPLSKTRMSYLLSVGQAPPLAPAGPFDPQFAGRGGARHPPPLSFNAPGRAPPQSPPVRTAPTIMQPPARVPMAFQPVRGGAGGGDVYMQPVLTPAGDGSTPPFGGVAAAPADVPPFGGVAPPGRPSFQRTSSHAPPVGRPMGGGPPFGGAPFAPPLVGERPAAPLPPSVGGGPPPFGGVAPSQPPFGGVAPSQPPFGGSIGGPPPFGGSIGGPPPFGGIAPSQPPVGGSVYGFDDSQAQQDGSDGSSGDMSMPPFGGAQPMKPPKDSKPSKPPKAGKPDLQGGAAALSPRLERPMGGGLPPAAAPMMLERSMTSAAMRVPSPARAVLRTNLSERSLPPILPDELPAPPVVSTSPAARSAAAAGPPPKKPMMKGGPPPKPKMTAGSAQFSNRPRAVTKGADDDAPAPANNQYGDVKRINRLAHSDSSATDGEFVPQFEGDGRASQLPPPPGVASNARPPPAADRAAQLPPPPGAFRLPPPNAGRTGALMSSARRGTGLPQPIAAARAPSRAPSDLPPAGRAPTRGGSGVRAAKPSDDGDDAPATTKNKGSLTRNANAPAAKADDSFSDLDALDDIVGDLAPLDDLPEPAAKPSRVVAAPKKAAEKDDFWDEFDAEPTPAPAKTKLPAPNVKSAAPAHTHESDSSSWSVICEVDGVNAACLRCLKCNESMCQQCYDAMCDPATHETAVVEAVVCDNDGELPAQVRCHDCATNYCQVCFEELHQAGGEREHHKHEPVGLGLTDMSGNMTAEFGDLLGALNEMQLMF